MQTASALLAGAIVTAVLGAAPAVARTPRVAIIQTEQTTVPRTAERNFADTILDILGSFAVDVVPPRQHVPADAAACSSPECLSRLSVDTGATHALLVHTSLADRNYTFRIELWELSPLRRTGLTNRDCQMCDLGELYKVFRKDLFGICSDAFDDGAGVAHRPVLEAQARPAPSSDSADTTPLLRRPSGIVALSLIAVGIAAVAYGGYLVSVDGAPACGAGVKDCNLRNETQGDRLMLYGGLSALLAGGGVLFWNARF